MKYLILFLLFLSTQVFAKTGDVCYVVVNQMIYYEVLKSPRPIGMPCYVHNAYGAVIWQGKVGPRRQWVKDTPIWK
jgi:hypothetical protein